MVDNFRMGGIDCCLLYLCQTQREMYVLLLALLREQSGHRGPQGHEGSQTISNLCSQTSHLTQSPPIQQ